MNYGDLSKAQRILLDQLLDKSAVSIDTALSVSGKGRQTADNLRAKGLVEAGHAAGHWCWTWRVWLTEAGHRVMRSARAARNTSRYRRFG